MPQAKAGTPIGEETAEAGGTQTLPGVSRAIFTPVTPEESERAIHARSLPPNLLKPAGTASVQSAQRIGGDSAPSAPASISELARALQNNPDVIYEYVRNNIEYYPTWGVQKGPLGTLLDNQGTAFDQASLMVALLKGSVYPASYVMGGIKLTAAQVQSWLGVDTSNACGVLNLLAQAQIPYYGATSSAGGCSSLVSIGLKHVWVKVTINGTDYHFDPSFKSHTFTAGIDLDTATGYDAATHLAQAKAGATVTANYIQGVNRANIRSDLGGYATNLVNYLRTNLPTATLDDVIGGMKITPKADGNLRQTSLPYQDTGVATTVWTDIPDSYKPTLRVQYQGIDVSFTSDDIYGRRLTLTYNGSNLPVLKLDGAVQATGTAAVTPGADSTVTFSVAHGAYAQGWASQTFSQHITGGGTYLVGNGWGPASRSPIELYRRQLDSAKAAGNADNSEPVVGSSLAMLSATWIAQVNAADYIADHLAGTSTLFHHQVGIAGYYTAPYVDLPGNVLGVVSQYNDRNQEKTAFLNAAAHSSIFESTAVQQTSGVSAVSTVKLIDIAAVNSNKIYDAKSANWGTVSSGLDASCAPYLNSFQGSVGNGHRLILPDHCNLGENSWAGTGYFDIFIGSNSYSVGAIINGGMLGGFATTDQTPANLAANTQSNMKSPFDSWIQTLGNFFNDPIDMAKGHFAYSHEDINVGVGGFPYALNFQRLYSSGLSNQDGPLGRGWTHNFAISATQNTDGFQGLGEDSALDAVNSIVEELVSIDLLSDAALPLDKWVVATLGQRWFGDQLLNNTVVVRQGLNGEVFVKLPDGSYNPPPGNSAKLTLSGGLYTYDTVHHDKLSFDSAGRLSSFLTASGMKVALTYTGNDLSKVQNSLGRSLTLAITSGRITQVVDENNRGVDYGYTGSNLTRFTDATDQITTYNYDQPGRINKIFYPGNPANAFVTNTYDSLGRVNTQTDANGKKYTYYFAGSRSQETDPLGHAKVSYFDDLGRVVKSYDAMFHTTRNTYDGQGRLVSTTLPEGNQTLYTYDDGPCAAQKRCTHNVKTVTQVPKPGSTLANLVTQYAYEGGFNQVWTVTDPRGKGTIFSYVHGQPNTVTRPADSRGVRPVTTYSYTAYTPTGYPTFYLPTSVTEKIDSATSVTTATTYDPANKYVPLTTTVDSGTGTLNLTTTYTYGGAGNLTKVDGPRTDVADTTSTAYDAERRPTQITNALGKLTKLSYDPDGRLIRTASQIGTQWMVSCRSYTKSGKLLKAWGPDKITVVAGDECPTAAAPVAVTDYAYDAIDRIDTTTERLQPAADGTVLDRVAKHYYYNDNRLWYVQRRQGSTPVQTEPTYTYSANGLPSSVTDGEGNKTAYDYDGFDRKLKTRYPNPTTANTASTTDYEQYGYDANGNLTSLRRRNGQTLTQAYDSLNRLTARNYPDTTPDASFDYDLLGRRTLANQADHAIDYDYDHAGRLSSTTAGGRTLAYQYDAAGNRTRITWPDANLFVTTGYDALNRPTALKENGGALLVQYAYDDLSRRTTITRAGNAALATTYGYDAQAGQPGLSSLKHEFSGTGQDVTWSYTRNQAGQIKGLAWNNDGYQWTGYQTANGSNYVANGLNQYTSVDAASLGYDTKGNLTSDGTWTYGYDLANRLVSANKTGYAATLAYDAENRLRQTTLGGVTTDLVYDGDDLVAEYDAQGNLLNRYVHGPGTDEPVVWYGVSSGVKRWLSADHLGSVVAASNNTGGVTTLFNYGPFGEPNTTAGFRFRYTGQQFFGTLGLYYYKARFYSPTLGRFLQTDPIGYGDGLNLYAYVGNDPFNRADPSGLTTTEAAGAVNKLWEDTVAASRNESASGFLLDKVLPALGPETGALESMGIAAIGAVTKGMGVSSAIRFSNLAPEEAIGTAALFPASQVAKASYTGKLNYVVTESGSLVIGRSGHTSLSGGADVLAAGEVKFIGGQVKSINNASGHYKPNGSSAQEAAESAFEQAGFKASGKYSEKF